MEPYFTKAVQTYPHFIQAYQEKAIDLQPQWGGNEQELLRFVRNAAETAPRGTAIPLIVTQSHKSLAKRSLSKRLYYNRADVWRDLETNYMRLIEDFPQAGWYALWFAETAQDAGRQEIAEQYFKLAQEREPDNPELLQRIP